MYFIKRGYFAITAYGIENFSSKNDSGTKRIVLLY